MLSTWPIIASPCLAGYLRAFHVYPDAHALSSQFLLSIYPSIRLSVYLLQYLTGFLENRLTSVAIDEKSVVKRLGKANLETISAKLNEILILCTVCSRRKESSCRITTPCPIFSRKQTERTRLSALYSFAPNDSRFGINICRDANVNDIHARVKPAW